MWSFSKWRQQQILKHTPVEAGTWQRLFDSLPVLAGLDSGRQQRLQERSLLFLHDKRLTALGGLAPTPEERLRLALQAQLPVLELPELDWYQGFHEILLYPTDFQCPQKHRDSAGVEHCRDRRLSGETWLQGPVILAWPGVLASGQWNGYNLIIHELAHKLDLLNGSADGFPPLHDDMRPADWTRSFQGAYDQLNHQLQQHPHRPPPLDAYAAENPAEFFAVSCEYFFSAPRVLAGVFPAVYAQLRAFFRQDPLLRHTRPAG